MERDRQTDPCPAIDENPAYQESRFSPHISFWDSIEDEVASWLAAALSAQNHLFVA